MPDFPQLNRLHQAAADVVKFLKSIPEFAEARIAVIGGLAVRHYLSRHRETEDIDFIIDISSAPQSVKKKLLSLTNSPFVQKSQIFSYRAPDGSYIQVDITPEWQSPYMPSSAKALKDIEIGSVPYISSADLIVFKINSSGLRAQISKKQTDILDAERLLEREAIHSSVQLDVEKLKVVEPLLRDLLPYSSMSERWWRVNLGLPHKSI